MGFIDKKKKLDNIINNTNSILELGCGDHKRLDNSIGIDKLDYECVDIVGDVFEVLKHFPDNSISAAYSYHFFEHITDINMLMDDLERVLKRGGTLEIVAPHFSNPYFYSDYTHKSFFGLYTFCYFASNSFFKRNVPSYNKKLVLELVSVDLIFKSAPPFYCRHTIKKVIEKIVNLTNYMKEFYEENLCCICPCYEIRYRLRKI